MENVIEVMPRFDEPRQTMFVLYEWSSLGYVSAKLYTHQISEVVGTAPKVKSGAPGSQPDQDHSPLSGEQERERAV
jgi:hypothetical protein